MRTWRTTRLWLAFSLLVGSAVAASAAAAGSEPGSFPAQEIRSNRLAPIASTLIHGENVNVLIIGDSLVGPWLSARWLVAAQKAFDHPGGYHSLIVGAGQSSNGTIVSRTNLAGFTGGSEFQVREVTNDYWGDGGFFGSLWTGKDFVARVGTTGYAPGSEGAMLRWNLLPSGFDSGVVPSWFDGDGLTAQFGILRDATQNNATGFSLRNGTGDGVLHAAYDATDPASFVGGTIHDQGLSLLADRVPIDPTPGTGLRLILSDVAGESEHVLCGHVIKINDDANPTGVALAALGRGSAGYVHTYLDAQPTPTSKSYRRADLAHYLQSVFDRQDANNFVFVCFAAEAGTIENQASRVQQMLHAISGDFVAAELDAPKFFLVSTWRTMDDDRSRAQAEVFYTVAQQRSDAALVSIYGISEGILLNGASQAQIDWAQANGYDSIELNVGALDVSSLALIDAGGIHQQGETAAFFFAHLVWNEILLAAGGDLNGDGAVTTGDLLILLSEWGACPGGAVCTGDLNADGVVGTLDLLTLLANWTG